MEEFMELEDVDKKIDRRLEDFTKIQDTKLMRNAMSILYTISDISLVIADTDKISITIAECLNVILLNCRNDLREIRTALERNNRDYPKM